MKLIGLHDRMLVECRGTALALSSVMQWYASTPDETSVRSLYRQMIEGWDRGSGADFAAPFAENSRFIAFDGTCFKGRDEIAVTHQRLFDTHLKGTLLTGQVLDIRFLREDVAVLYAAGNTVMRGKIEPSPERESVQTLVAVKDHGQWQLTTFHNTRVRPIGRDTSGTFIWLLTDWLWKVCRRKG